MTKNGGKLNKSHKFAEGGLLNNYDYGLEEVNAGGSHEENPNEGVVVSYAPDGLPNKVEEGETIHNDYVYSKRLEANEKVLKNNLLDEKYEGKSFADISKKLTEDRKKRPNDPISVRTNEENLNRLQDAQEELKLDNKTREVKRFLGSLNND
jgi:predicted CopG family antitoxin